MKTVLPINALSNILVALALPLFIGLSISANAEDFMPETDPAAPCGELNIIGQRSYLFNQSDFTINVVFKTNADHVSGYAVNAGAVKYLERDANGHGVWRDTGIGDYRSSKIYTIPVNSKSVAVIVYCASRSPDAAWITGEVSFTADPSEAPHQRPDGNVGFTGKVRYPRRSEDNASGEVKFQDAGNKPYALYDLNPFGETLNGSMTICQDDTSCSIR